MAQPSTAPAQTPSQPPTPASPRFQMELEFVCSLANPYYLQHMALSYPGMFLTPEKDAISSTKVTSKSKSRSKNTTTPRIDDNDNSDAARFARYLTYLLDYWQKPEYAQYLTHPAATIRNLQLLQNPQFRRDVIRPDIVAELCKGFGGVAEYVPPAPTAQSEAQGEIVDDGEVEGEGEGEATALNGNASKR